MNKPAPKWLFSTAVLLPVAPVILLLGAPLWIAMAVVAVIGGWVSPEKSRESGSPASSDPRAPVGTVVWPVIKSTPYSKSSEVEDPAVYSFPRDRAWYDAVKARELDRSIERLLADPPREKRPMSVSKMVAGGAIAAWFWHAYGPRKGG